MNRSGQKILGILLAAGSGSRFSGTTHKLLAPLGGEPVIAHSLRAMLAADLDDFLVVTGAVDLSAHLGSLVTCHNADWSTGQRSSVLMALRHARAHDFDAVIIGLADQPFITTDAWNAVSRGDSPIVVATYDGHRGNPVKLDSSVWELFKNLESDPDEGARTLIRLHPELVLEVACKGASADIDTPEDLEKWT
jgi:molybdenum cofactor cytidylyltransferase